jgi:probable phosphoglycerate mutase
MTSPRRRLVVEADGGSRGNPGPAGWGALVRDAETGHVLAERAGYLGVATNNVAEYSGLVAGLEAARDIDPDAEVEVRMDSRLVVEQMSGRWQVRNVDMRSLVDRARAVLPPDRVTYTWVQRAENGRADALANQAMDTRAPVVRDHAPAPDASAPLVSADSGAAQTPAELGSHRRPPARQRRPSGAFVRFDDEEPLTVVLVRHGETEMTAAKAYSGSSVPGPGLTARGRTQAAQAADLVYRIGWEVWPDLPRPTAVVASPMVRTQQTAAAVGRRLGLEVTVDPAFAEADFGEWEGLTPDEIEAGWPGGLLRWHRDPEHRAPGGESMADVGARVGQGLERLLAGGVDRTVVVVSHSVAIRTAVGVTLGLPSAAWGSLRIAPASLSIVRWWEDGAREVALVGMPTDV